MIVNEKYSNKAHPFGSNGGHRRPAASGIPGKEWLCDWLQGANRSPASSVGTFGENRGRHRAGGHDGDIP